MPGIDFTHGVKLLIADIVKLEVELLWINMLLVVTKEKQLI